MYCFAKICRFCKKPDKHCNDITSKMFQGISHIYNNVSKDTDPELNMCLQQVCQKCFQILTSICDIISECKRTDIIFKKYLGVLRTNGKYLAKYECIIKNRAIHCADINQGFTIKKECVEDNYVSYIYDIPVKIVTEDGSDEQMITNLFNVIETCDLENTKTQEINFNPSKSNECNINIMQPQVIKTEAVNEHNEQENIDLNSTEERDNLDIVTETKFIPNENIHTSYLLHENVQEIGCEDNSIEERNNLELVNETKFISNENINILYLKCERDNALLNESVQGCEDNSKQQSKHEIDGNSILVNSKLKELLLNKNFSTFNNKQCDVQFLQNQNHVDHLRNDIFVCNVCNKTFNKKYRLIRHAQVHTGERPFECNVCNKKFTQNSSLIVHIRIHTGERPFECDVCYKKFITNGVLIKHKRIHTSEYPFECDVCSKKFNQKMHLVYHKHIHADERPFECDACEKKFTRKGGLIRHKRIHSQERPYECEVCDKKFKQKYCLTIHTRIHTGESLFKCDVCNKIFTEKGNLIRHKRIHSGERPFECDVCNKRFIQKSDLIKHVRRHRVI